MRFSRLGGSISRLQHAFFFSNFNDTTPPDPVHIVYERQITPTDTATTRVTGRKPSFLGSDLNWADISHLPGKARCLDDPTPSFIRRGTPLALYETDHREKNLYG